MPDLYLCYPCWTDDCEECDGGACDCDCRNDFYEGDLDE